MQCEITNNEMSLAIDSEIFGKAVILNKDCVLFKKHNFHHQNDSNTVYSEIEEVATKVDDIQKTTAPNLGIEPSRIHNDNIKRPEEEKPSIRKMIAEKIFHNHTPQDKNGKTQKPDKKSN